MKREGNLIERICEYDNLYLAFYKASKGKREKQAIKQYELNLKINIDNLKRQLSLGQIIVGNYNYFKIFDPKERQICAADFGERVLHHAIMNVCSEYFEKKQIFDSYATRVGKGAYLAIEKGKKSSKQYKFVAKLDMRKYFDSISHTLLKKKLRTMFKDQILLTVFDSIIDSYEVSPEYGIPIGNLTSQYFANFYLSSLDHYAKEKLCIPVYIRYMDDILVYADTIETIREYVKQITYYAQDNDLLTVKEPIIRKTEYGVSFLGYKIYPDKLLLNRSSKVRFTKKIKQYNCYLSDGIWNECEYQSHIIPLLSFVQKAYTKNFRKKLIYG